MAGFGEADAGDPLLVEAWSAAVQEGEDACLAYLAHTRGTVALWQERYEDAAAEYRDALGLLPPDPGFGPGRGALRAARAPARAHGRGRRSRHGGCDRRPGRAAGGSGGSGGPVRRGRRPVGPFPGVVRPGRRRGRRGPRGAGPYRGTARLGDRLAPDDRLGRSLSAELPAALEADGGHDERPALLLGAVSRGRPAVAREPGAPRTLRERMTPRALRAAYAQGARTGLRALLPEP
ncbi:hypothetical protein [Streptomyces sp. A1136]|uniref:hypothetical protein n=1 Tax=Streptomyces sp. A1136 TaxID=2563102 RepID=UPI00109EB43E|nr:hypothetical protein [Streptomyces sp. A1136]THA44164.1 hypothetical protein E6R62_37190 [Streptomyces sp. A1136]